MTPSYSPSEAGASGVDTGSLPVNDRREPDEDDDSNHDAPPPAVGKNSGTSNWKFGNLEAMNKITKSPYEGNQSAEVGESLFDRLKLLLLSQEEGFDGELQDLDGLPDMTVQPETVALFGEVLAENVVKAYNIIAKSGILFSPPWLEHKQCKIRGERCGWIAKPLFLLLLQEQRFAKAADAVLASVVNSIGVNQIFFDALQEWNFDEPKLQCNEPYLHFATRKRECLKCLIFVARVYRCTKVMLALGRDVFDFAKEEPSLYAKVRQCLEILNRHVKVPPKRLEDFLASKEPEEQSAEERSKGTVEKDDSRLNNRRRENTKAQKRRKIGSAEEDNSHLSSRRRENDELRKRRKVETVESTPSPSSSISSMMQIPTHASFPGSDNPTHVFPEPLPSVAAVANNDTDELPNPKAPTGKTTEELLRLSVLQYKRLGRTIKRLKGQIENERQTMREELRREIMEELEQETAASSRRSAGNSQHRRTNGIKKMAGRKRS